MLSISSAMQNAMWVVILSSMPVLIIAMAIGLIMGIIQTATSIQEQTLAFIPKILAVIIALLVFGPWMFRMVGEFTVNLFTNLYRYIS